MLIFYWGFCRDEKTIRGRFCIKYLFIIHLVMFQLAIAAENPLDKLVEKRLSSIC